MPLTAIQVPPASPLKLRIFLQIIDLSQTDKRS